MKSEKTIIETIDKLSRRIKKMYDLLFEEIDDITNEDQEAYMTEIKELEMRRGMLEWALK